jgi:uncharacterized protein YndB with AHSA1/START domain
VSSHREQAHLDAPVEAVWSLIGSPNRYPDWWPRVIEVRGERFEEGDEFVQVIRGATGRSESSFLLDRVEDLHEIRMTCRLTGTYAHWSLTQAQEGTFVDLEMGMDPKRLGDRIFDATAGRLYFQSWSQKSLAALGAAAHREQDAASAAG